MKHLVFYFFFSLFLHHVDAQEDYDSFYIVRNCVILDGKESVQEERDDLIYNWNFGDGTKDQGEVVEHCYDSIGTYDVVLYILDPIAAVLFENEWNFEVTISEDYLLSFEVEQLASNIVLQSNLTHERHPSAIKYYWDYGDGVYASGDMVDHTYTEPGEYEVRLLSEVIDEGDIFNLSLTKTIIITKE